MKKTFYLFVMLLFSTACFTSCSNEEVTIDELIGQWQSVSQTIIAGQQDEGQEIPMTNVLLVFSKKTEDKNYDSEEYVYDSQYMWKQVRYGSCYEGKLYLYDTADPSKDIVVKRIESLKDNKLVVKFNSRRSNGEGVIFEYNETITFEKVSTKYELPK